MAKKHIKRWLLLLDIREMQIKNAMIWHLIPTTMPIFKKKKAGGGGKKIVCVDEDIEKL